MSQVIPTEGYEVHRRLGRDLLEILPVDAHTLHVYWEISDRKKGLAARHFQCDWGMLPKVLRLHDVTCVHFHGHNANCHTDVEVTPESDNWYITGIQANTAYSADIGIRSWEGHFVPLLRSRTITTPRDFPALYGEPILPVYEEARDGRNRNGRLTPRFHENFIIYQEYAK